jgi:hypothetical protein
MEMAARSGHSRHRRAESAAAASVVHWRHKALWMLRWTRCANVASHTIPAQRTPAPSLTRHWLEGHDNTWRCGGGAHPPTCAHARAAAHGRATRQIGTGAPPALAIALVIGAADVARLSRGRADGVQRVAAITRECAVRWPHGSRDNSARVRAKSAVHGHRPLSPCTQCRAARHGASCACTRDSQC